LRGPAVLPGCFPVRTDHVPEPLQIRP
jgi:hypothetical protein